VNAVSGTVNSDSGNLLKSFTLKRNHCSRSPGISVHDQTESGFTLVRNTQQTPKRGTGQLQKLLDRWHGHERPNAQPGVGPHANPQFTGAF